MCCYLLKIRKIAKAYIRIQCTYPSSSKGREGSSPFQYSVTIGTCKKNLYPAKKISKILFKSNRYIIPTKQYRNYINAIIVIDVSR